MAAAVRAEADGAGVRVLVDAAHAPGQLGDDIEALGADHWVGNLHKWAYTPRGSAILWSRPGTLVTPTVLSWQLDDGYAGFLLQLLQIDVAVLLLAAIFLFQILGLRSIELLIQGFDLALQRTHDLDGLVDLVEQPLALLARVLELANNARNQNFFASNHPAGLARFASLDLGIQREKFLLHRRNLLLVAHQRVNAAGRRANAAFP